MRRLSALVGAALAAAGVVLLRRRRSRPSERVDVYYADGSMISLEQAGSGRDRALALAREALDAARGSLR